MKLLTNLEPSLRAIALSVDSAIARYPSMWSPGASLAFSGGKDSIALAAALRITERKPRLRAVDMGYNPLWHTRIRSLASVLELPLDIVAVSDLVQSESTDSLLRESLITRKAVLDSFHQEPSDATPCTNCYNCKIISLVDMLRLGDNLLLFGHHLTDALSSLLKFVVMIEDRFKDGNAIFEKDRFRAAAMRLAGRLADSDEEELNSIVSLIRQNRVSTSEPPTESRVLAGVAYRIARPMFAVSEGDIAAAIGRLDITPEASGCGHTAAQSTRTPREIVQFEMLPKVQGTALGRKSLAVICHELFQSFNVDGSAKIDFRADRHAILGSEYKGSPSSYSDRL